MHREGGRLSYFVSDIVFDDTKKIAYLYIGQHDENGSDPAISTKEKTGKYSTHIVEKNQTKATLLADISPSTSTLRIRKMGTLTMQL